MAQTVLITGSTSAVQGYADAVAAMGATPVVARTAEELTDALTAIEDGALRYYIQLPTTVSTSGETVTARVHNFLVNGLLARYRAAEGVLPKLADDSRVILVAGNVNTESAAPDDRAARLSLVHVLKHSLRADKASPAFDVRVAAPDNDPSQVAKAVLAGVALDSEPAATKASAVDPGLDYMDWRTEVLGGMHSEF